jgi:hypothetical protein
MDKTKALTKHVILEYRLAILAAAILDNLRSSSFCSELAVNAVSNYPSAIDSTENFQCLDLIKFHEERRQLTKGHAHFQSVLYHNFALGARHAHPIFGLKSTLKFVSDLLHKLQEKEGSVCNITPFWLSPLPLVLRLFHLGRTARYRLPRSQEG